MINYIVVKTEQNIGKIIGKSRIDGREVKKLDINCILNNFKTISEFKDFLNNPNNEIIPSIEEDNLENVFKFLKRREKINKIYVE